MKKIFTILVTVLILSACAGSKPKNEIADPCFEGAPQWVVNPQIEGTLAATGSAKKSAAGMQFAKDAALANARSEISRMIEVKVDTMMKDFTQVTGVGDAQTVDKVTSSVSKQISSQVLQGTMQKNAWFSPCGELYVLVAIDSGKVAGLTKNLVMSSMKNDAAIWQQFQARKAQGELDKAINKEFGN